MFPPNCSSPSRYVTGVLHSDAGISDLSGHRAVCSGFHSLCQTLWMRSLFNDSIFFPPEFAEFAESPAIGHDKEGNTAIPVSYPDLPRGTMNTYTQATALPQLYKDGCVSGAGASTAPRPWR